MSIQLPTQEFFYRSAGPASATDIAAKTVWVYQVVACNTSAGALTISLADKSSTPIELLTAKSIAANDTLVLSFDPPLKMSGGLTLNTPAAVDVQIQGLTNPNIV